MQPWFSLYFLDKWHHVMINWHQSNQVNHWPVPRDHIAGSSLSLTEVMCFIKVDRWRSIGFRLDRGLLSAKIVENRAGLFKSLLTLIQV